MRATAIVFTMMVLGTAYVAETENVQAFCPPNPITDDCGEACLSQGQPQFPCERIKCAVDNLQGSPWCFAENPCAEGIGIGLVNCATREGTDLLGPVLAILWGYADDVNATRDDCLAGEPAIPCTFVDCLNPTPASCVPPVTVPDIHFDNTLIVRTFGTSGGSVIAVLGLVRLHFSNGGLLPAAGIGATSPCDPWASLEPLATCEVWGTPTDLTDPTESSSLVCVAEQDLIVDTNRDGEPEFQWPVPAGVSSGPCPV